MAKRVLPSLPQTNVYDGIKCAYAFWLPWVQEEEEVEKKVKENIYSKRSIPDERQSFKMNEKSQKQKIYSLYVTEHMKQQTRARAYMGVCVCV